MNKRIISGLLLILFFPLSALFAQAEKPVVYDEFLRINENAKQKKDGKVKKMTELYKQGAKTDTVRISYYDANGLLIKELIAAVDTTRKDNPNYYLNLSYNYDKEGRLTDKIDSTWQEPVKKVIFYDEMGDITRIEEYLSRNKLFKEVTLEYDDLLRLIEVDEINYSMNCKITSKYQYDSYNSLAKLQVKNLCKDPEGKTVDIVYAYKYDKNSNILEKSTTIPGGLYKNETYKYDTKGHVTEGYVSTNREEYTEFVNTYDKNFNKIKIDKNEVISGIKTKFTVNLKYDSAGNLIEEQNQGPNGDIMYTRTFIIEQ